MDITKGDVLHLGDLNVFIYKIAKTDDDEKIYRVVMTVDDMLVGLMKLDEETIARYTKYEISQEAEAVKESMSNIVTEEINRAEERKTRIKQEILGLNKVKNIIFPPTE